MPLATAEVLSQQQPKSNKESQQQLAEFVQRAIPFLDSDQLQQRQQTEQALIAQGPRVLDLLPTDLETYSSEIRTRLDRIRQKLYEEVAIQTAGGSSFSLSGVYRLPDVIRELESQTGNLVITSRDIDESIELDLQDVPFYRAFDNILDLAGLDVEPYFAPHPNQILVKPRLEEIQNRENSGIFSNLRNFTISP